MAYRKVGGGQLCAIQLIDISVFIIRSMAFILESCGNLGDDLPNGSNE